ncbi:hypothetical protein OH77DRAFT_647641 [Trametes cingulata]|nr:hypothetical protein OH77DRAFT_647641 [Trametes cingulata]
MRTRADSVQQRWAEHSTNAVGTTTPSAWCRPKKVGTTCVVRCGPYNRRCSTPYSWSMLAVDRIVARSEALRPDLDSNAVDMAPCERAWTERRRAAVVGRDLRNSRVRAASRAGEVGGDRRGTPQSAHTRTSSWGCLSSVDCALPGAWRRSSPTGRGGRSVDAQSTEQERLAWRRGPSEYDRAGRHY